MSATSEVCRVKVFLVGTDDDLLLAENIVVPEAKLKRHAKRQQCVSYTFDKRNLGKKAVV